MFIEALGQSYLKEDVEGVSLHSQIPFRRSVFLSLTYNPSSLQRVVRLDTFSKVRSLCSPMHLSSPSLIAFHSSRYRRPLPLDADSDGRPRTPCSASDFCERPRRRLSNPPDPSRSSSSTSSFELGVWTDGEFLFRSSSRSCDASSRREGQLHRTSLPSSDASFLFLSPGFDGSEVSEESESSLLPFIPHSIASLLLPPLLS